MNADRRALIAGMAAMMTPAPKGLAAGGRTLTGYLRTNWSRDPHALGSYSFVAKGADRQDHSALAAPVGRLFFAGEAAHPNYNSTVHAAYESGLLAAGRVMETDAKRIAVIGAGVAGLAAANVLWAQGHDVTVIEARDRIGGRIWTNTDLGPALDLGASWIHGATGNPVAKLAREAGLRTVETDHDSYIHRGGDGRLIWSIGAPGWLEDAGVQASYGADPDQLNFDAYGETDGYDGPELVFPGGYHGIIDHLTTGFPIVRGEVRAIAYNAGGVGLSGDFRDRTPGRYDAAICTLPLGVLKAGAVTFDPPLPKAKQEAIDRLGYGLLDKLYLMFEAPFWDDETWIMTPETALPRGQFNMWLNLHKLLGVPALLAFNGASPALALAGETDDALLAHGLRILNNAYQ